MQSAYSLLIVDDEASIRRLLQKELAAPHWRVLTTGSAREALQMCREESFDVVLLDIRMPDGDGLELLPSFLSLLPDARLPFVIKNCAGLQKELARSELFGHVRGAFTNALESSEGLMTVAQRGTLFLDEVGELPLEVQGQLLRVLESRRYRRVGEKEERSVDVRFLFATNRNLAQEVQRGCFHEAFLHRINVFQLRLPPLRDRREDIPLLVRHFLSCLGGGGSGYAITPGAMDCLLRYHWPGNVRELRNVIERGLILAEDGVISERALPHELVASREQEGGASRSGAAVPRGGRASPEQAEDAKADADLPTLEEVERRHILRALAHAGGNKQEAAKMLGIARKTLYRKLGKR